MLRRFVVGLLFGAVIGAALAAALVGWLRLTVFHGALEAYGAALVAGVVTGLVTGKPIWASDAKVEAGLKAAFGGLLAAGGMFAMRRWGADVDLRALGAAGPLGDLPVASLPLIGGVLGALFELDNTDGGKPSGQVPLTTRVAQGKAPAAATAPRPARAEPDQEPAQVSARAKSSKS